MVKQLQFKLMLLLCALVAGTSSVWADNVASFSRSGTTNTTTGGDFTTTFSAKSGYYQDNNNTCYMQIFNNSAYWTTTPASITLTSSIGGGSGNKNLTEAVYAVLLDSNGNEISNSKTSITSHITTNTGDTYKTSIPVTNNVYGIKIYHTKESGYNVRYYSFTLSYTSGSGTPTCATPTFTPEEGTYTSAQNVTISTETEGATIYYTTDGNDPTTSSSVYSSPISVSSTTTIKAMAVKDDYDDSSVASATYTIKTDPALAFSAATAEATIGQAFTAPTLTNSYSVAVTWSSSDESVATVSDGTVTLVGEGTTIITASFDGDDTYIASEASYTLSVTDPSVITLWSEDFSSYSANDVPSGGTYSYACTSTTKIYDAVLAGGTTPELLVAKSNGTFTATVPLNNASGNLTLTYKTNAKAMSVSTTTEGISGGDSSSSEGEHTVTFTGVTTSMTSITIVFTATSSDNVRLDDILLRGKAQAVSVEAPQFSVNGGTYYTAQSVELACATEGATIYYSTDNTNWNEYKGAINVSTTTTLYAKAVKGSDESTVSSITITIAEKNDVVFNITDKSLAYGESYTIKKGNYDTADVKTDGNVTLSTSNEAVVSFSGTTITANAVGEATITIEAAEGDTYKTGSTTITVTVTAPTAQTTAPAVPALFNETFDKCDGSGGRDNTFTGSVGTSSTTNKLDESWATIGSNGASKCIKLGTGNASGTVTTSNIALTGKGTLTFSAAGWGDTSTNTVSVEATGATLSGDTEVTMKNGEWKNYSVDITGAEGEVAITFTMKRGFLDDVIVIAEGSAAPAITATLNTSGYATFCSLYPLDFTNATGYSAWQITDINNDNEITFTKITGSIKGGQGILLKGDANDEITLTSADSDNELGDNYLEGTLAPLYVTANKYYGLKGESFVPVAAGTVPAGKALLDADWVSEPSTGGARALTFVFADETTGITNVNVNHNDNYYNLNGQRVVCPKKGLYIKDGKKVFKK